MACPTCFGLIFVGSKFCDHCGAIALPTTLRENDDLGDCPRCQVPLALMSVGSTDLRECIKCDGIWADATTFETVCADRERQSAVLGFMDQRTVKGALLTKISYVKCPECGELMNRSNFARASGVIVDICKKHGVWFDADELPKIVEFIQKGGMEIARQKEKLEIESERGRLRDEQRMNAAMDQKYGVGNLWQKGESPGVRSFIRSLFD